MTEVSPWAGYVEAAANEPIMVFRLLRQQSNDLEQRKSGLATHPGSRGHWDATGFPCNLSEVYCIFDNSAGTPLHGVPLL